MTNNVIIRDFIDENKNSLFVYSLLIAVESVLMIFFKESSVTINTGVFQAALLCGIALLFFIWIRFIWNILGQLRNENIDSVKKSFLIAQNAVFAILIGYPIFALLTVIYQIDTVNFIISILAVIMFVGVFAPIPFIKFIILKINEEQKSIVLLFSIILLAVLGYFWIVFLYSPPIITDISQIKNITNYYVFFSLTWGIIIAQLIGLIIGVYSKKFPPT
jgi:hypothetical protein